MNGARVESIDALMAFRAALWKFAETAQAVLSDAESELQRTVNWLDTEQHSYWQGQIRKRTELVAKARQALLVKKLMKNVDGTHPSAIEEEQVLKLAMQRLEEAEQKLGHVRRHGRLLQKVIMEYKGQVQRLTTSVTLDLPQAVSHLDSLVAALEAYVAMRPAEGAVETPAGASTFMPADAAGPSMARAEPAPGGDETDGASGGKLPDPLAGARGSEGSAESAPEGGGEGNPVHPEQQEDGHGRV